MTFQTFEQCPMDQHQYVIGVDYGTDSVRSIIVNAKGEEIASSVFAYPRWRDGLYCDPSRNQFRQHPLDYVEGLETSIKDCLSKAGSTVASRIKGISVDTTGSTPVAVDKTGTPLSLTPPFRDNPNAMFFLWKDHTAIKEAEQINIHAQKFPINYLQFVGGIYSSEWFWAKLLHALRVDESVRSACYSWVEHCDWIPFLLTGGTDVHEMRRGVCSAGHKALWAEEFNGLPPEEFFSSLDQRLKGFRDRLFNQTYSADKPAGLISREWSERLGVPANVVIGIGAFDAHMGAVGGQIEPYFLSKVMGTSTCDMLVTPLSDINGKLVRGICGQVNGSVIPGMIGLEAGQSAFGDTYAWFRNTLTAPVLGLIQKSGLVDQITFQKLQNSILDNFIPELTKQVMQIPLSDDDELAIDWLNGRRTPDADQSLTGAITGLSLGSDAPHIFKAWVEATCFGAKAIADRFVDEGIPVKGLIGLGGVARKSPYIMQVMADVMNMPIRIHRSEQTCALGAAMFAATASGVFKKVEDAMAEMGPGFDLEYHPNKNNSAIYAKRYLRYKDLGLFLQTSRGVVQEATLS